MPIALRRDVPRICFLTFDGTGGDPLDEAALEDEEDDQERDETDHGGGHLNIIDCPSYWSHKGANDQGQSKMLRRLQINKGADEIVPGSHKKDQSEACQAWSNNGQYDAPENCKLAGSIDSGCVYQLIRDRHDILPHKKDTERIRAPRDDQRPERVNPFKVAHDDVNGH